MQRARASGDRLSTNLELKVERQPEKAQPALEIRFGQVGIVQLRLRTTDPGTILDELTGRVATAPRFFQRTAVCLDLTVMPSFPDVAEVRAAMEAVRRAGMLPIALTSGAEEVEALAATLELPLLASFRPQQAAVPVVQPVQPVAVPDPTGPALIHSQPVRSGQRLHARGRDLVVTASVGPGAELMADGCVHVYGCLRGRAMAGTRGETSARVFCQEFHAELVSIAGVFRVFESIPADLAGKPVQAWLAGESLHVARL